MASLEKRLKPLKFLDFLLLFLGIMACVIPGVLFAWVRIPQLQNMHRIVVRVDPEAAKASSGGGISWSDDGAHWWDGAAWRDAAEEVPPGVSWSDDDAYWWDGQNWRPAPSRSGTPASVATLPTAPAPLPAAPSLDVPRNGVDASSDGAAV
jgi:hypothetical protein